MKLINQKALGKIFVAFAITDAVILNTAAMLRGDVYVICMCVGIGGFIIAALAAFEKDELANENVTK